MVMDLLVLVLLVIVVNLFFSWIDNCFIIVKFEIERCVNIIIFEKSWIWWYI